MIDLGYFSLLLGFALTLYSIAGSMLGVWFRNQTLVRSAERTAASVWLAVSVSAGCLIYLLVTSDFGLKYVADYTNRDLPLFYKIAAFWAGQSGSLLFWTWLLSTVSAVVLHQNRDKNQALMPHVTSWLMISTGFFLVLNLFAANPFDRLGMVQPDGRVALMSLPDGQGLNPLLQYFAMVIHPPVLFLGYVGFTVPFAFAMAALMSNRLDCQWLRITRRWTLVAWGFQGAGILLGAQWAYMELGWGGYWAWDPVENASLLPWLTGTALLHSAMVQERRGMFKAWNLVLAIATFLLCIFGTFLTRSGIVSSVHAFGKSNLGTFFIVFMLTVLVIAAGLILARRASLQSDHTLNSLLSRESSVFYNNLVLVVSCLTVLLGTMFPVISELFRGEQISVGPPFFNRVHIPIALILLLLTGAGPFFAWRQTSVRILLKNLALPAGLSAAILVPLLVMGIREWRPLLFWFFCAFVALATLADYFRDAGVRRKNKGEGFLRSLGAITFQNTRRYGGYIVHLGVALLFMGLAGAWFNQETEKELAPGDSMTIGRYQLRCTDLRQGDTNNYAFIAAVLQAFDGGIQVATLTPERRLYKASQQASTEVSLHPTLREDLYVVYKGQSSDGKKALIQAFVNPLVNWLWIGGILMMLGTIVCLIPNRRGELLTPSILPGEEKSA